MRFFGESLLFSTRLVESIKVTQQHLFVFEGGRWNCEDYLGSLSDYMRYLVRRRRDKRATKILGSLPSFYILQLQISELDYILDSYTLVIDAQRVREKVVQLTRSYRIFKLAQVHGKCINVEISHQLWL
jgi:hypothetical protein